jgi:DNA-binding NarL/FixJ family response regulator
MPVLDGTETTRRLTAEYRQVAVVVLTTYLNDTSVLAALRAGARSYLTKDADHTEIVARLFVTSHTVKSHINRIFAKTGSRDRAAAIGYAHRHGLG